jgi:TPR repeat protein
MSDLLYKEEDLKALAEVEQTATSGNTDALKKLGEWSLKGFDEEGRSIPTDRDKSLAWYTKAAELGDAEAQYMLGEHYNRAMNVENHDALSFAWYKKAAEQGYAVAQHKTGTCYYHGIGTPQDKKAAWEWFQKAADQGHASSIFYIGFYYRDGDAGIEKDSQKAVEWFYYAAEKKYNVAYDELKKLAQAGDKDAAAAFETLNETQRQNVRKEQADVSEMLAETVRKCGNESKEALKMLQYTTMSITPNIFAMYELGNLYREGIGVPKSKKKAAEWYAMAADMGCEPAVKALQEFQEKKA